MSSESVKVLLVDDLEENLVALEALLRRDGLELMRARSGPEALELLLVHDFALALVDVKMPGMDGLELAELMRGTERTRRIPIIFITAGAFSERHRFRGYEAGAVDFIFKPVDPHVLLSKADIFLELYRQRHEVARQRDELRASEEQLRLALSAGRFGNWQLTLPDLSLTASDQCRANFGREAEDPFTWETLLDSIHPEDRAQVAAAIDRAIEAVGDYEADHRCVWPDGSIHWINTRGRAVAGADGLVHRMVGVTLDITERKRLEEALKEADRRKDEFLAMLAHELRNPLVPIRNAVQVMKLVGLNEPRQQWASEIIERQTQQLTRLVDDLLDVSRITQGKVTLQRETLDLSTVIQRAVETSRPLIDARKQILRITLPPHPIHIDGDLTRLVQVISNLLNNASKYTDEGGQLQISAAKENNFAVVSVHDEGIGMTAELLPRVFDLFTQADRSLDRSEGGLGIGLTLVRNLVELHGGHVEARSSGPSQGSEFIVRLPALAGDHATSEESADEARRSEKARLRVLVVEDNRDSAEMMALMLQLDGHEVMTAYDGPAALTTAITFQPQVVLCDIGLPGMSGYEVAQRLRALSGLQQTWLIALTGYGQEEARRRARESGFDHHLVKPVDPDALGAMLGSRF